MDEPFIDLIRDPQVFLDRDRDGDEYKKHKKVKIEVGDDVINTESGNKFHSG